MTEQVRRDRSQAGGTAAGATLADMIREAGENVSRGIEQMREDVTQRATGGAKGAALLAGAGAAGTVTVLATASLPLIALRRVMPGWAIVALGACGAGGLTGVLARRGLAELGAAVPTDADDLKSAAREALHSMS